VHPEIRALCSEGIDVLRRLHEAGFQHLDYHAGNLLVLPRDPGEGPTLRLLDLDTVVRRSPFASSRARELCRFIQNFVEPHDYREVIQTALEEYANGDRRMLKALERSRPVTRLLERRGVQTKDIVRARQAAFQT
jgi:predicted unusual protein kinase regulating ubiquinone biosynthesis (AarF/ABC1/UbiB family)